MAEPVYGKVMVIVAHPDDAEFGVAGTAGKWSRVGTQFVYVICTDGSKGTDDPELTPDILVPLRQKEQRAAAAVLGVHEVVFLGHEDGTLYPTLELRRDISRQIRIHQPDVVFCPDPTTRYSRGEYINHPDHRAAGEAALNAVFPDARNRWMYPELLAEGLPPFAVREVYLMQSLAPTVWVDIGDTIDLKLRALAEHKSQVDATQPGAADMVRGWARLNAEGQSMTYAEVFKRIVLR
ncbi:MAG: PIG-L family deacetylase [Chloroflexi bacterium]|nr:PIG-L family deacetylase [Chloroflexota bacterium]